MWKKITDLFSKTRDISTIGIVDIASNGIASIFWFYVASILSPDEYGEISYVIAIAAIVSSISLPGVQNGLTVFGAKKIRIQSTLFLISMILGSITSIAAYIIFSRLELSILAIGYIIFNLIVADLIGRKLFSTYAKYVLIHKILTIILGIGLYYVMGIEGIIIGVGLSSFPYLFRIFREFKETKIDFSLVKTKFRFLMTSYATMLVSNFNGSIDKLIIAPFLGFALLGNYHLGLQFLSIFLILPSIIYKYTLPHDASGNSNNKIKTINVLISVGIAALGIIITPYAIPVFFPEYTESITIIQLLSISVIPSTISMNYTSKFLGREKNKIILGANLLFLPVQIIGIVLLGMLYGIIGVVMAYNISVISETIFYLVADRMIRNNKN